MRDTNHIVVIGYLTKDVDLSYTKTQRPVANFRIATHHRPSKDGTQNTSWINCKAWNKTGELITQLASKGTQILVEGELFVQNYTDSNNNMKSFTWINVQEFRTFTRNNQRSTKTSAKKTSTKDVADNTVYEDAGPETLTEDPLY